MFSFFKMIIIGIIIFIALTGVHIFTGGSNIKDTIINTYDNFIQFFGEEILTNNGKLKGKREYGKDHYVGTYKADYKKFTGIEYLFGGTTVERKNGDTIHTKIEIDNSNGKIAVIMKLGVKEKVLASENGIYEFDFDVKDGSNYMIVKAEKYSGNLKIESR